MKFLRKSDLDFATGKAVLLHADFSERVKTVDRITEKKDLKNWIEQDLFALRKEISIDQLQNISRERAAEALKQDYVNKPWRFSSLPHPEAIKVSFLIQRILEDTPYDCGNVDGVWTTNSNTRNAIGKFQEGIMGNRVSGKARGVPGPRTVEAIVNYAKGLSSKKVVKKTVVKGTPPPLKKKQELTNRQKEENEKIERRKRGIERKRKELGDNDLRGSFTLEGIKFKAASGDGYLDEDVDYLNDDYEFHYYVEDSPGLEILIRVKEPHNFCMENDGPSMSLEDIKEALRAKKTPEKLSPPTNLSIDFPSSVEESLVLNWQATVPEGGRIQLEVLDSGRNSWEHWSNADYRQGSYTSTDDLQRHYSERNTMSSAGEFKFRIAVVDKNGKSSEYTEYSKNVGSDLLGKLRGDFEGDDLIPQEAEIPSGILPEELPEIDDEESVILEPIDIEDDSSEVITPDTYLLLSGYDTRTEEEKREEEQEEYRSEKVDGKANWKWIKDIITDKEERKEFLNKVYDKYEEECKHNKALEIDFIPLGSVPSLPRGQELRSRAIAERKETITIPDISEELKTKFGLSLEREGNTGVQIKFKISKESLKTEEDFVVDRKLYMEEGKISQFIEDEKYNTLEKLISILESNDPKELKMLSLVFTTLDL